VLASFSSLVSASLHICIGSGIGELAISNSAFVDGGSNIKRCKSAGVRSWATLFASASAAKFLALRRCCRHHHMLKPTQARLWLLGEDRSTDR